MYQIHCGFFANTSVGSSDDNNFAIDAYSTFTHSTIHVLSTTHDYAALATHTTAPPYVQAAPLMLIIIIIKRLTLR